MIAKTPVHATLSARAAMRLTAIHHVSVFQSDRQLNALAELFQGNHIEGSAWMQRSGSDLIHRAIACPRLASTAIA